MSNGYHLLFLREDAGDFDRIYILAVGLLEHLVGQAETDVEHKRNDFEEGTFGDLYYYVIPIDIAEEFDDFMGLMHPDRPTIDTSDGQDLVKQGRIILEDVEE